MKTKTLLLAGGGVAVVGLLVGLLVLMNKKPSHDGDSGDERPTATNPRRARPPGERPIRRATAEGQGEGDTKPTTVERDGGTYLVREHEPGEAPRNPSPITHVTIAQIRTEAAPAVRTCSAPLRQKDPMAKGRLRVTATAVVAGGRVILKDVDVKPTNMDDADVVECVKKVFEQISFDAPVGQEDGEQKVHIPFVVP